MFFPIKITYKVAILIANIKYFFSFCEKREMVENLRQVLPLEGIKVLKKYSKRIFANFSKYLVDFLRFSKVDASYIEEHVEIINKHYVDDALKKGKGAILLTAHLGNWELGAAIMGVLGYSINVLALDHKNKFVNNFFIRQRQTKNERIISTNFGIRKCLTALLNNESLAIAGDKDFTSNGSVVKFFGKDTLLPKGAAALSLKTGAAIIPAYTVRTKDDDFELIFEPQVEYAACGDFERDVALLTQSCAWCLENCIRRYPMQWYCFRRFWLTSNDK